MVVFHSQQSLKNLASEFASPRVPILEITLFLFCFLERKEEKEETKKMGKGGEVGGKEASIPVQS